MSKIVSEDAIKKAKEILGLISKAEQSTATSTTDVLEKAIKSKEEFETKKAEYQETLKKGKELMEKAEAAKKELTEANMGDPDGDCEKMPNVGTVTMKAEEIDLIKAELSKGFEDKLGAKQKEFDDKMSALGTQLSGLTEMVEKIGKSSNGPKSIIKANALERFTPTKDGEKVLSLAGNKQEVIGELVKAAGNDLKMTNLFAKAASTVEIAGALGGSPQEAARVAQKLRELSGIIVVA